MSEKYSAQNLMLDTIIGQINSGECVQKRSKQSPAKRD